VDHVYAVQAPRAISEKQGDDTSVAVLTLSSGAVAILIESFAAKTARPGVHGVICGSEATVTFEKSTVKYYTCPSDGHPECLKTVETEQVNTFELEIAHFADCINGGIAPITSAA
jgi:predicted dehydrogenase